MYYFHLSPEVGKGSGFIAELPVSRVEKKVVLMTCNHVLPSLAVAQKASIYFGRSSKKSQGTTIEGHELFYSQFFLTDDKPVRLICWPKVQFAVSAGCNVNRLTCPVAFCAQFTGWKRRFDYTVVEVKMDVLQKYLKEEAPEPLSLTKCAEMMKNEGLHVNNMLHMVHYPKEPKAFDRYESSEQICRIEGKPLHRWHAYISTYAPQQFSHRVLLHYFLIFEGPYIGHMATSYGGSSGSPMLREYNNELIVVGLHRGDLGSQGYTYINIATLITVILDDIRMVDYDDSKCKEH